MRARICQISKNFLLVAVPDPVLEFADDIVLRVRPTAISARRGPGPSTSANVASTLIKHHDRRRRSCPQ